VKKGFFSDPKFQGLAFLALGLGCFLLAGLLVFFFSGRFVDRPSGAKAGPALSITAPADKPSGPPAAEPSPSPETRETKEWVLYITGGVASPGVYSLPTGSRVHNLVDAAGGLLPNADPVKVNLAAPLADGVHVHVPLAGEDGGKNDIPVPAAPQDSGFLRQPAVTSSSGTGGAVRVNTATLEELQRLPGVGPAIARAILEYRTQKGRFSTLQDLLKVKGIGPKKLESLRDHVDLR
jgi:competence protein ComEA